MRDLLEKVATKAMDKWDMMGLVLNIDQHQLNTITHQNPVRCYSVIFYLWEKKADPPFTWATIIDALRSPVMGETKLALDIERWLKVTVNFETSFSLVLDANVFICNELCVTIIVLGGNPTSY